MFSDLEIVQNKHININIWKNKQNIWLYYKYLNN